MRKLRLASRFDPSSSWTPAQWAEYFWMYYSDTRKSDILSLLVKAGSVQKLAEDFEGEFEELSFEDAQAGDESELGEEWEQCVVYPRAEDFAEFIRTQASKVLTLPGVFIPSSKRKRVEEILAH